MNLYYLHGLIKLMSLNSHENWLVKLVFEITRLCGYSLVIYLVQKKIKWQ